MSNPSTQRFSFAPRAATPRLFPYSDQYIRLDKARATYAPPALCTKGTYGPESPVLFTKEEFYELFAIDDHPQRELIPYRASGLPHNVGLWDSMRPEGTDLRIGYLQPATACCGAALIALPHSLFPEDPDGVMRSLEYLSMIARGIDGRSFLYAIATSGQPVFHINLQALGYTRGPEYRSKKTSVLLTMYVAPRVLTWKFMPASVVAKMGEP